MSADAFSKRVVELFSSVSQEVPQFDVLRTVRGVVADIYDLEAPLYEEPKKGTLEHAKWRDKKPPDLENMAIILGAFIQEFTKHLPPMAKVPKGSPTPEGAFTRVEDLINLQETVTALFYILVAEDYLPVLKKQLIDNSCFLGKGKPIFPEAYKGDPLLFFSNTPIARVFRSIVRIVVPDEYRYMGHWVCAASGTGKTTMLLNMLHGDVQTGASVILMDAKGELVNEVRHWKSIKDRLVVVDPSSKYPVQLNPLDGEHPIDSLMYLFSTLLDSGLTGKQTGLFRSCLRATLNQPNPTIDKLREVIQYGPTNPPDDLRQWFETDFKKSSNNATKEQIFWRLHGITETPALKAMLNAPKTLLNLGELMDSGKVVVIDITKNKVGENNSEFFGRLFLFLILNESIKRSGRKWNKPPVYVYIDEANKIIRRDESFETLLDTCRSENIAFIISHQRKNQIEAKVLDALEHVGIRMSADTRGQFKTFIRGWGEFVMTTHQFYPPEHMTQDEEVEVLADIRAKYCAQPSPTSPPRSPTSSVQPEQSRTLDPDNMNTEPSKD